MSNIEPSRRCCHVAVRQEHYILVFGGTWHEQDFLQEVVPYPYCDEEWMRKERLPLHDIWMYNLYTEEWRKHVITDRKTTPSGRIGASATLVGSDIYMFGGMSIGATNSLWKLTRTPAGCFAWHQIKPKSTKESPSPRIKHSAWEFAHKLWIFGGFVPNLSDLSDYLNNYGDYSFLEFENNQILCFDPSCTEWTNPQSFGDIPAPRSCHSTAIIRDKAWLYGGFNVHSEPFGELHELDMHSLTWTMIENCDVQPFYQNFCTLTAITDNQLVMNYGISKTDKPQNVSTWILDISTKSWNKHSAVDKGYCPKIFNTCTRGINNSVMIIGGEYVYSKRKPLKNTYTKNTYMTLKAKSLQHLAIQKIWKHKHTLPWQESLPRKLRYLFGFLDEF